MLKRGMKQVNRNKDSIRKWRVVYLYEETLKNTVRPGKTFYGIQVKTRKFLLPRWSLVQILSAENFAAAATSFNNQGSIKLPLAMRVENYYLDEGSFLAWRLYIIVAYGFLFLLELMRLLLLG